jgi:SHAQKYF class myb-like DNA-binding protein
MPSNTPANAEGGDDAKPPSHRYENSEKNSSSGGDAALVAAASQAASLATAAAAAACVNHSVVPDLMRVYESMTQTSSNSPSKGGSGNTAIDSSQDASGAYGVDYMTGGHGASHLGGGGAMLHHPHYFDPASQQGDTNNMYYAGGWGNYDASALSIPIPAPYSFPLPQQSHSIDNRFSRSDPATEPPSGRPVRAKRNVAAVLDDGGGGYDSSAGSSGRGGTTKSRRKSASKNSRSAGGNTRSSSEKNEDKNDGRWSKRFTWPDDLHRDFVSAIFDVGLKHSSPSTVMEHMPPHEQITTERIKSHLQKYRLHRQKAKKEFMTSYQATMQQMNADGLDGVTSLAGGQVAAHLAYASQHHPDPEPEAVDESGGGGGEEEAPTGGPEDSKHAAATATEEPQQDVFFLPNLTEAEKVSPIGLSLGYLMGLFFSLRQQLDVQRQEQAALLAAHAQQEQHAHLGGASIAVFEDFVSDAKATTAAPVPMPVPSSSRSNLEVNSLIKREMQNQMAFQNKMRALKQQELNKYSKAGGSEATAEEKNASDARAGMTTEPHRRLTGKQAPQEYQGAGESGGADTGRDRTQSMSLGEEDDFWNTSVVDEELFDFLMNN